MGALISMGAASAAPLPLFPEFEQPAGPLAEERRRIAMRGTAKRYSLYEHIAEVESIADMVEALDNAGELDGDTIENLQKRLIAAIAGTKDKIDRTTAVLASFEAAEAAAKREAERLEARAKHFARQRERLEEYVIATLTASNLKVLEGNTSRVSICLNPPSVQIAESVQLAPEFMRTPPAPAPVPDKTAIKAALQRKEYVPGCRLMQTTRLVRE